MQNGKVVKNVPSFYETEQTRRLVLDLESGRWRRTGDFMTTVGADSALLQLPDHVEDKVPLHADHSMVVKFDTPNAAGYRTALDRLRQFVHDAPLVVAARFAIEYSYRVRESAPDVWVFWIHASNAARLEQGYQEIAAVAEIPGWDDPKTNLLQLVCQWLCDARNGHWLMVLDNADDDRLFFSGKTSNERGPLVTFLPQASHGSILITSRNGLAARNLVGNDGHVIVVQPMNEEESLARNRARIPASHSGESGESRENEKTLVQALEYIPLAITQAGSYIANRFPLITVSAYLRLFHESELKQTRLLQNEDSTDLRRDPSIRYAVIVTWQLSFEQIRRERPAATELLALMSMFDRQGIPEDLVRDPDQDILDFHDALAPLLSYSLVRLEMDERLFDMHRLTQLSARAWLDRHQQLHGWQAKSRGIMARVFPNGDYESWTQCRTLLAHAKSVLTFINDVDDDDRLNAATLSSKCGQFLNQQGAYEEAGSMHQWALEVREKVLGREHPDTLTSVNQLGNVLNDQGQYEEAEAIQQRALEAREKVLGREHPDTLTSFNNLGNVLYNRRCYNEAEAMFRRTLALREKVLGREHPDTLSSVNNLGNVLDSKGKYEEAESEHRRALKGFENVLGREHPATLRSIANLGLVLARQGNHEEAEAMHRRALEAREKVLGREHPDTLNSVSFLGFLLALQGKYEEAEAMFRRAFEARGKVLGREHPDTLTSAYNLGSVLGRQGKYEEAEAMYRGALEGREKVLGCEHRDTLRSVYNLGAVLESRGKYEEAEAMYQWALEGRKKLLGCEHPDTLTSVNNLGSVLHNQGKYEEAEAMHRWAFEARGKVLGRQDPDTLISVNNLGLVLDRQGKYEEAEAMHRWTLEGCEKVFGREHPATLTTVNQLGNALTNQGQYEEAEAILRRALEAREKVLGREHPDTLTSAYNLGSVLGRQGKYEKAEAMRRWALEGCEKVLGCKHPATLGSASNPGLVLSRQGKHEEAEAMHRWALEAREKVLGTEHPDTLSSVVNLGNVLLSQALSQGKYEELDAMRRQQLKGSENVLGREHSSISEQAYLSPHSVEIDNVVVPLPDMQVQSSPSTALCLISDPLPANISILEFRITSHDQGFCNDPSQGTWTWFEVSIIRPWCEEPSLDIGDIKHSAGVKPQPEDFGDLIQERGWYVEDIPILNEKSNASTDYISREILRNPVSRLWSAKRVTWLKGELGDFVSLLQEGDRLLVWARAQYPGWVNYVREVQIALRTGDSTNVHQDMTLQTVNSRTLMERGILPRNIFSTPHPLLQIPQRHNRSLGEKEDHDVD